MKIAALMLLALMIMAPAAPLLSDPPQNYPAKVTKDDAEAVKNATERLQNARRDLDHAGGEWGGHREAAIKHIDAAIAELGEAEKWAREHHDIK